MTQTPRTADDARKVPGTPWTVGGLIESIAVNMALEDTSRTTTEALHYRARWEELAGKLGTVTTPDWERIDLYRRQKVAVYTEGQ